MAGKMGTKQQWGPLMPGCLYSPYPYCYRCPFGLGEWYGTGDRAFCGGKAAAEGSVPAKEVPPCGFLCQTWMDKVVDTTSTGDLAAVILEPYQGGAGFIFPPEGWLRRVQEWCRERGVLFIVDEVQASFGRTGKLFAIEHEGLQPNLLCLGKGIGSGIPTAALMAEGRIMSTFAPGEMSSTTGGNPVSCAAAHAVLDIMEEEQLVASSAKVGAMMLARFKELQGQFEVLGDARGKGLVIGLEFVKDKASKEPAPELTVEIIKRMCERGVVCGRVGIYGNVLRVAPPLVITEEQANESVDVLEGVLGGM